VGSHIVAVCGGAAVMSTEEYVEAVLDLVERIPPGRVMTYGAIADALAEAAGRASPRQVGTIMARYGSAVPWHRVVNATGRLVPGNEEAARRRHAAEGTPMRGDRVDIGVAAWHPDAAALLASRRPHDPGARAADLGHHRSRRGR
jgi:methylated-DNA-protein-cysteine methyltransferase related protein